MRKLGYVLVALLVVRVARAAYVVVRDVTQARREDDDVILHDDDDDDDDDDDEQPRNLSHGYVPGLAND